MPEPIALELPPGMHGNGTALQSRGRWRIGNLVRWQEGALLPQSGWVRRKGPPELFGDGVSTMLHIDPAVIVRTAVPATVNGQVLLDRVTSAAFASDPAFVAAIRDLGCAMLRWPTTGHNNLPKFHPLAAYHTYFFSELSTTIKGNLWNPTYNQIGYVDEDGRLGDGTGIAGGAGAASEIINLSAFGQLCSTLGNITPHIFFDWQNGISEGNVIGGVCVLDNYRDPFALDIDDNPIPPATLAAMTTVDFKKLENRRFLRHCLDVHNLSGKAIVSMGGEDWNGWIPAPGPWPWPYPDPDQDLRYQYIYDQINTYLTDLQSYATSKGYTQLRYCVMFQESLEGGQSPPISAPVITNNLRHFGYLMTTVGSKIDYAGCSLHYRGTRTRFYSEDELQFAFFTPGSPYGAIPGQASFAEARAYIKSLCVAAGHPAIDMFPIANSVGLSATDPLALWEKGLAASQYLIETIKAGVSCADAYAGIVGDYQHSGAAAEDGVCGKVVDTFTREPEWYALNLFGQVLLHAPDAIDSASDQTGLIHLALRWGANIGLFLLNKNAAARTISATVANGIAVINSVKRYSQTETTIATLPPSTVTGVDDVLSIPLTGQSLTYVEFSTTTDDIDLFVEGCPRAAYIWRDNENITWLAVGTHTHLFAFGNASDKQDITPTGFTTGLVSPTVADGYGMMDYGEDDYGTPRSVDAAYSISLPATMWTFGNWGENLIGHTLDDGRLFEYAPGTAQAVPIVGAPTGNRSFVVTNERIMMALGADGDPRLIRWSDQEDNTNWTPDPLNQAGDITLQTNGQIVTGRATPDGVIIWTTEDVWIATYSGFPFVFGFRALAGKTTLASRGAMAVIDSRVAWMGQSGFWIYDGYMNPLPCDVQDRVFNHMNVPQMSKVWALVNYGMFEAVWFYPSENSQDIDSYVTWNFKENYWITGKISRTCGVPAGILLNPILLTYDATADRGYLYNHGIGYDYEGLVPYVESWPIEISEGGQEMMIKKLIPDEITLGDVQVTFKSRQYPTSTERTKTYTLNNPTNTRVAGRQVAIRFDGVRPVQWRIGRMRIEVKQLGSR